MHYPLVYITTYFDSPNEERRKEVLDCIRKNIESSLFAQCIILTEEKKVTYFDGYDPSMVNVRYVIDGPSYEDAFACRAANAINVIANSDILFNATIKRVTGIGENDFYAISRYENINGVLKVLYPFRGWTQDVWVIKGNKVMNWDDEVFYFGQQGCDHRIAWIADASGYKVSNPAFSIRTLHMHQSLVRISSVNMEPVKSSHQFFPKPSFLSWKMRGTSNNFYWANILIRKLFLSIVVVFEKMLRHIRIKYLDKMF